MQWLEDFGHTLNARLLDRFTANDKALLFDMLEWIMSAPRATADDEGRKA